MHSAKTPASALLRQRNIARLQQQNRRLQNEIDFVEILVQFWPWENMATRMKCLQERQSRLVREIRRLQNSAVAAENGLPFQRRFA